MSERSGSHSSHRLGSNFKFSVAKEDISNIIAITHKVRLPLANWNKLSSAAMERTDESELSHMQNKFGSLRQAQVHQQIYNLRSSKQDLALRDKLLAHVNLRDSTESLTQVGSEKDGTIVASNEFYVLRKFEP